MDTATSLARETSLGSRERGRFRLHRQGKIIAAPSLSSDIQSADEMAARVGRLMMQTRLAAVAADIVRVSGMDDLRVARTGSLPAMDETGF